MPVLKIPCVKCGVFREVRVQCDKQHQKALKRHCRKCATEEYKVLRALASTTGKTQPRKKPFEEIVLPEVPATCDVSQPTQEPPGSPMRMAIYAARIEAGLPLLIKGDSQARAPSWMGRGGGGTRTARDPMKFGGISLAQFVSRRKSR